MSHILKEYSKSFEVAPSKPIVNRHFYPVVADDYIVIYNEQNTESKEYRYYPLALDLVRNFLTQNNIKVIIIGSGTNVTNRADYVHAGLSFRENCYIISKAKLFVSIDNALTQYAGSQDIPVVGLYGNIYSSITTPYWSQKHKKIDLEPKWDIKPSMSLSDPDDPINKIPAESVAKSILSLLKKGKTQKINFKTKKTNTTKEFVVDVIPTKYVNHSILEDSLINIRLDRGKINEEAFYQYCLNHKCNITTENLLLQPEVIKNFAGNIKEIKMIIDKMPDKIDENYFTMMKRLDIKFSIVVKNKDILDDVRFEYFDQNVEFYDPPSSIPDGVKKTDKFFSFKSIVEGDKTYKCTHFWKNDIDNSDNVVDNSDYWEESDYFYIYED